MHKLIATKEIPSIYKIRELGQKFSQTSGSDHYKGECSNDVDVIEPFELMFTHNIEEDFCIGNILKYGVRFKQTNNLKDLIKVADYANLLIGSYLVRQNIENIIKPVDLEPDCFTLNDLSNRMPKSGI